MERGEEMGAETPSFNCGKLSCSAVLGKLRIMQQAFFIGGFSAAFLYLVITANWTTCLHQNFDSFPVLHSVHNKIVLTNNCICHDKYL